MTPPNIDKWKRRPRGFALVLVLGFVVLVVSVLVAFLFSATTERSASAAYAASITTRQLGDTAVALVQAQVTNAATQGSSVAWTSQPGMVRTFDSSGTLINAYKLYSAPAMVSPNVAPADDLPPEDWSVQGAMWVDLNAPITANGTKIFPIADPAALSSLEGVAGLGPGDAKGFKVTAPLGSTVYQPIPMPVRWLYVLRDGSIVEPTPNTQNSVAISGESRTGNPVVGRIGFWADDETAKVNINTASEGSFWDTPRGYTQTEVYDLALKQPAFGEYNRFPGHPGTVSLSSILPIEPLLSPLSSSASRSEKLTRTNELAERIEKYLQLTPRYRFGGSEGGTLKVKTSQPGTFITSVEPKGERLYTSLDEMIFDPERNPNSLVSRSLLESRRFFLTAHGRSPETNLFNLPRVAIWPVCKLPADNSFADTAWQSRTNPFDRMIALCASTGEPGTSALQPYFFQRESSTDATNDYSNIPRNQQLYGYLQKLTGSAVPGYGGDFLSKYGPDRDQILTEIVDYIRCTNLYDDLLPADKQFTIDYYRSPANSRKGGSSVVPLRIGATMGVGRYYGLSQLAIVFLCNADGSNGVPPPAGEPNEEQRSNDANNNFMLNEPFPSGPAIPLGTNEKRIQAMIMPSFFCPMIGWQFMRPYMRVEIDGLDTLELEGKKLGFPSTGYFEVDCSPHSFTGGHGAGGELTAFTLFSEKRANFASITSNGLPSGSGLYPFVSKPVTVPKSGMNFDGGGPITVRVYMGLGDPAQEQIPLVQTVTLNFPATDSTIPTPSLKTDSNGSGVTARRWSFFSDWPGNTNGSPSIAKGTGRLRMGTTGGYTVVSLDPENSPRDVARAVVPKQGDFRLSSAMHTIGKDPSSPANDFFQPHPDYHSTTVPRALIFDRNKSANHTIVSGSVMQNYLALPGVNPADNTGDFDNGPATIFDYGAPACNKPDEGQIVRSARTAQPTDDGYGIPYYATFNAQASNPTFFSPNRMLCSPAMFGSLPTGVKAGIPWRTLLFRPPAAHETAHTEMNTNYPDAKDSLFLDLFWMPVVEPYAISDRFSSAGKVNMNYQIQPFTYIERSAPIRAVFQNSKMTSIPTASQAMNPTINSSSGPAPSSNQEFRHEINVDETLAQFEERFGQTNKNTNVFLSPSEICNVEIVPHGTTLPAMNTTDAFANYWAANRMTGDNLREKIYATLYQKLTTKSNTYTVHFLVQSLKKAPASADGVWSEGRDIVSGEYRGSATIERFIDPNATIPDYAASSNALSEPSLDTFYKWRVVSNKQFAP